MTMHNKATAKAARILYRRSIDDIRDAAEKAGYAIAVHGSLSRDVDMVAIPWTDDALSAKWIVRIVEAVLRQVFGWAKVSNGASCVDGQWVQCQVPEPKPHGRMAWSIHVGGAASGSYVDLSVMPRSSR